MEIETPSSRSDRRSAGQSLAAGADEDSVGCKPQILIVDDEFFVAWHTQSMLEDMGFADSVVANDSVTAIRLTTEHDANLLLMDVNLGGGPDGVDTVRAILENRAVAVIFITAYTDEANLRRIRDVKSDAIILSKPVSFELLQEAIRRLLPAS